MMIKKYINIIRGCIGVVLGAVGAVLPLIPAFPFLLMAAVCFAKSSPRLHNWFTGTKLYKENLESFVAGRGMTQKSKIKVVVFLTITMGFGFYMMDSVPVGRAILSVVWAFHVYLFFFRIKTLDARKAEFRNRVTFRLPHLESKEKAKELETALDSFDQLSAAVSFKKKTVTVCTENRVEKDTIKSYIASAGFAAD